MGFSQVRSLNVVREMRVFCGHPETRSIEGERGEGKRSSERDGGSLQQKRQGSPRMRRRPSRGGVQRTSLSGHSLLDIRIRPVGLLPENLGLGRYGRDIGYGNEKAQM